MSFPCCICGRLLKQNGRGETAAFPVGKNGFTMSVTLMTLWSRTSVYSSRDAYFVIILCEGKSGTLVSNDRFQQPLIPPWALKTELYIFAVRKGIALVRKIVAASVWKTCILISVNVCDIGCRDKQVYWQQCRYDVASYETAAIIAPDAWALRIINSLTCFPNYKLA